MKRKKHLILALMAVGLTTAFSCSKESSTQPRAEVGSLETRLALLNSAANLQASEQDALAQSIDALILTLETLSAAQTPENLDAARDAWLAAFEAQQRLDMLQIGPAGPPTEALGGMGLRDETYSWPLVNPCRVDQELLTQSYDDDAKFAALAVNARGLDAIEYALYAGNDNACPPNLMINTDGSWTALSEDQIQDRRAQFALVAAEDAKDRVAQLQLAWTNGFRQELTDPANGNVYGSTREAINAVSNAMFQLDTSVKDLKLAVPAGISGCLEPTCPESRESKFGNASLDAIKQNLTAFDLAYHGGARDDTEAIGFDDLLLSIQATDLHQDMVSRLDACHQAAAAIDTTLADALADNPEKVVLLHTKVLELTDLMKTQFLSVLDLDLPQRAEGDND